MINTSFRPRSASKCRYAFTLIELLVVVAIIAILVAILMPSLGKARKQARQTQCLSNMRQVGMSVLMYAQDSTDLFPMIQPQSGFAGSTYWFLTTKPYLTATKFNTDIWYDFELAAARYHYCPEMSAYLDRAADNTMRYLVKGRHFAMNMALGPNGESYYYGTNGIYYKSSGSYRKVMTVMNPGSTVMLSEFYFQLSPQSPVNKLNTYYMGLSTNAVSGGPMGIHGNSSNVDFVDGHAEMWNDVRRIRGSVTTYWTGTDQ